MDLENLKSRDQLKQLFVQNAIPTQEDFADLINAGLNQVQDGIVRPDGDRPLGIKGVGPTHKVLGLYTDFTIDPAWTLSLTPATDRNGLAISDTAGTTRLFIDRATGRVGIGTTTPAATLDVAGGVKATQLDIAGGVTATARVSANGGLTISEAIGTRHGPNGGSLLLDHDDVNGATSIVFRSKDARGNEYGFIQYHDHRWDVATNGALLAIGVGAAVRDGGDDHIALLPSGNVGIGTIDPTVKLDVNGTTKTLKLQLGTKWLLSGDRDTYDDAEWLRLFSPSTTPGLNYYGGFAAGKMWVEQGQYHQSDGRTKVDVTPIDDALQSVSRLSGVKYRWREDPTDANPQLGLIAQEVEEVFPELVSIGPNGMKALNYNGLIAPIIEALNEQTARVDRLERQVECLGSAPVS